MMVRGSSYMFVTGPDVVKTVTHEDGDARKRWAAPAYPYAQDWSMADLAFTTMISRLLLQTRRLFNFLPLSNKAGVPCRNGRPTIKADRDRDVARTLWCPTIPNQVPTI